jgi:hypothetical protein
MTMIGPSMIYRLDTLSEVISTDILKEYLIIFTNKYSYNLYKDYWNIFKFIIIEDYTNNYPISQEYELFLDIEDEAEYNFNLKNFYNNKTNRFFPYEITRFIFPYLVDNNILNFVLIDSDCILYDNKETIETYFDSIPEGTFYAPLFGEDSNSEYTTKFFIEYIQPYFEDFKFKKKDKFINCDGYARGFHFRSKEDMLLLFKIWNKSLELLLINHNKAERLPITVPINCGIIFDCSIILSYIMFYFSDNKNYNVTNCWDYIDIKNKKTYIHISRPEEKLYYPNYPIPWYEEYNFEYNGVKRIQDFIIKNKKQLELFYTSRVPSFKITDTHVYIKPNINE